MSQKDSQLSSLSKSLIHSLNDRQKTNSVTLKYEALSTSHLLRISSISSMNNQNPRSMSSKNVSWRVVLVWRLDLLERQLSEKVLLNDLLYQENWLTVRQKTLLVPRSISSREIRQDDLRSKVVTENFRLFFHFVVRSSIQSKLVSTRYLSMNK